MCRYQKMGLIWFVLFVLVFPSIGIQADSLDRLLVPSRYFDRTGHNVGGRFLTFYDANGGETIFGLPITEVIEEQSIQTQYFEHVCLEIYPDRPDLVKIAALGKRATQKRMQEPAFLRHKPAASEVSIFFPATGHNLSYAFREFWQNHGGHPLFGFPISEAFIEYNKREKRSYTVQYFERVRLEYYLEHPGGVGEVRVSKLGSEYAEQGGVVAEALSPVRPIVVLGSSTLSFTPLPGDVQNVNLAVRQFEKLKIQPGEEISYLETVGELTSETGYVPGSAIIGGGGGQAIAGGICYLSTVIFQAVARAGLEIVERHPHTILLPDFQVDLGMDSAVFTADGRRTKRSSYDLDLRWRNDMPDPIIITTDIITKGGVTVSVWGYDDGRKTVIKKPSVDLRGFPDAIWRYDEHLHPCEVKQIAKGNPGMGIMVEREVKQSNGKMLHQDRFYSSYSPLRDVFVYGPGVTPVRSGSEHSAQTAREVCLSATNQEPGP